MAAKLFVGGLPWSTTDRDLSDLFSQVGSVVSSTVIMDRASGRSKGFGFVEMGSEEEAKMAVEKLNETMLGERKIIVNEAKPMVPREERSGGFGGGSSFGGGYGRDSRGGDRGGSRGGDRGGDRGGRRSY